MGGQPSKPLTPSSLQSQKINHPLFQHAEVLQVNQKGEQLIKLRIPVNGEKIIKDWEDGLASIKSFNKQSLFLPAYHSFESQGFCGTSGILNIFYPYYPYLLAEEIENREAEKKNFSETELWYLLYTISAQAVQFHRIAQGSKLGDIRPINIFINQGGYIKIANIWSWPNAQNNYQSSLLSDATTYLSPQQLEELHYGKNYPETNSHKSESFSVGLTLLDCINLQDSSKLYDFKKYYFFEDKLKRSIEAFLKQPLSEYFKRIVLGLLELDVKKRLTVAEVCKELEPHQKKIMKLQAFDKPGYYQKSTLPASEYATPEGSSNMYASEVTKGFNDKLIGNQQYQVHQQQFSPNSNSPPPIQKYNYTAEISSLPQPKFPLPQHNKPNINLSSNYNPPKTSTMNSVYLAGSYQSPSKPYQANQTSSYIPTSSYSPNIKYEMNSEYQPNQVSQIEGSPNNAAGGNRYADTYGSSYIPSGTGNYTTTIDPNSYKITQNDTKQEPLESKYNFTKSYYVNSSNINHPTATATITNSNIINKGQIPLILPNGSEQITYEIDGDNINGVKIEEGKKKESINELIEGIKQKANYQAKEFLPLKEIEDRMFVSQKQ